MGNFKTLRVWKYGMDLTTDIYKTTRKKPFSIDYGLKNQIERATVSIPSNIAEGDDRGSNRASVYFFNIAKGSSAEVITQLNIAYNIGYIDKETFQNLENQAMRINASLKNLIKARGGENITNKAWWFILAIFLPI
ncbi:MAG: four helix bundle protein [Saprospiraceae bacterium]